MSQRVQLLGESMTERSSHSYLALTDGIATRATDPILLAGRVLLAVLFLMTVWGGGPNADYLKSLGYPAPAVMSTLAHVVEWVVVVSLLFGVGTRYGALLAIAFVVIAFATAHRYWDFPQAAQNLQYTLLSKDLAITGGLLLLFVTGPGRWSVDERLRG
ncbi:MULTISPECIES: DoxX family protein [Bradyrhizobium]|uniref:DoxX family protein n=1 Tax=Bradyrhizobium TaxID=374 RepID=UPI002112B6E0|nr:MULTISPECIES: DoxX family protein [Bradyrhizobium]